MIEETTGEFLEKMTKEKLWEIFKEEHKVSNRLRWKVRKLELEVEYLRSQLAQQKPNQKQL